MGRTENPTDRLEASRGHRHWAKEIGPNQPLFRVDHGVRPKNNLTEPSLLEMSGYGVISNEADRFKRFHSYCFGVHEHTLPMARESRLCGCVVSPVPPQLARAVLLHRFGVAHQTSLRSPSTMMSYAISP